MQNLTDNGALRWALSLLAFCCTLFLLASLVGSVDPLSVALAGIEPGQVSDSAIREIIQRRLDRFEDDIIAIQTNLKWQGIFILFTLLILGKGLKSVSIAGLSLTDRAMVYLSLALPAALLFLWIEFGYLYIDILDNRIILSKLIDALQASAPPGQPAASLHPLISDHWMFVDFWVLWFERGLTSTAVAPAAAIRTTHVLSLLKMVGYGAYFALGHACMIAPICRSYEHFNSQAAAEGRTERAKWIGVFHFVYITTVVVILMITHIEFYYVGRKPNAAQVPLLVTATVFTWIAVRYFPPSPGSSESSVAPSADE